jgi:DNA-binding IclR family transcriptional regulator
MGEGQLARYFQHAALARFTDKTITDKAEMKRQIAEVRRTGVAYDDGEYNAEVRCSAVPVYAFTGRVQGAIGISGPIWRLSIQLLKEKSKQVRQAAAALSKEFGSIAEPEPTRTAEKTAQGKSR